MKASELVRWLDKGIQEWGDLDVAFFDSCEGVSRGIEEIEVAVVPEPDDVEIIDYKPAKEPFFKLLTGR
jgi:hypothetical protein